MWPRWVSRPCWPRSPTRTGMEVARLCLCQCARPALEAVLCAITSSRTTSRSVSPTEGGTNGLSRRKNTRGGSLRTSWRGCGQSLHGLRNLRRAPACRYGYFRLYEGARSGCSEAGGLEFATVSEAAAKYQPVAVLHCPHVMSWADEERDITAWLGNELQNEAFGKLYALRIRSPG